MRSPLWLALVCISVVSAAPSTPCTHKVKEDVPSPRGWIKGEPAPPDASIELRIALPQPNFSELERHLYEVRFVSHIGCFISGEARSNDVSSDPFHERYGQHLSKGEVESLVAPHPESLHKVNEWLASHGLYDHDLVWSPAKDWIRVKVSVSLAEKMMDTVSLLI